MAGVPVDMLVDIGGPANGLASPSISQQDDDPFELCSIQGKGSKVDLELALGLALEKSIKLHSSQSNNQNEAPIPETPVSTRADCEILVKLEDSPDKKAASSGTPSQTVQDGSDVFIHAPSNPFELAWDVIEQEALTLANHIQHDKEKQISPRKMVDMAMKLSPDSLLLSPRNPAKDEEFLINSSPEQEMKKTPRVNKMSANVRRRPSIGASPVVARSSYATPLRQRVSLAPQAQPSPLKKPSKPLTGVMAPSPAKPFLQRGSVRAPLLRSSSATAPLNQMPSVKPAISTKAAPMKAVHQPVGASSRAPLRATASETPVRRSVTPSPRPSIGPAPGPTFQSKLRTPLSRSESEALHQTAASKAASDPPRSLSVSRYGMRKPVPASSSAPNPSSTNSRSSLAPRIKAKGRENVEPA